MSKYYHHPNSYGAEGEDHINISPHSEFYLGKVFEPSFLRVVQYPYIGKFRSVSNLWLWLKVKPIDDSLRRVGLREFQRILVKHRNTYVPNFRLIIAHATWLKIKNDPVAIKEIKKLPKKPPVLSYYIPKGSPMRVCSNYADIIVPIVTAIVDAVQADTDPDFNEFAERGLTWEMDYLKPFLIHRLGRWERIESYIRSPVAET